MLCLLVLKTRTNVFIIVLALTPLPMGANMSVSEGFLRLIELGMPESTLEHMVVENSESFADDVVESARERLRAHS